MGGLCPRGRAFEAARPRRKFATRGSRRLGARLTRAAQTYDVNREHDASVHATRPPPPALPRRPAPAAPASRPLLDYRAVFVSDVHLGVPGVRDDLLLEFLRAARFDALYLLGDFVDALAGRFGRALDRHQELLHELWALERRGVAVTYVPGNHDAFARRYAGLRLGRLAVEREAVHEAADGRRLWLVHGDEFDRASKGLTFLADAAVEAVRAAHRLANAIGARFGAPYRPYASRVRRRVKTSVPYLAAYERAAAAEARRRGFDGVVCGHLHMAEIAEFDGVLYANDGDWVDSCTALAERRDGAFELIDWPALRRTVAAFSRAAGSPAPSAARSTDGARELSLNGRAKEPSHAQESHYPS